MLILQEGISVVAAVQSVAAVQVAIREALVPQERCDDAGGLGRRC